MLQCIETEVDELRHFVSGGPHAEYPARILGTTIAGEEILCEEAITAKHPLSLREWARATRHRATD
jgi:hypothetical protein